MALHRYGPGQNMYDRYRNVIGIFMNQLQVCASCAALQLRLATGLWERQRDRETEREREPVKP